MSNFGEALDQHGVGSVVYFAEKVCAVPCTTQTQFEPADTCEQT